MPIPQRPKYLNVNEREFFLDLLLEFDERSKTNLSINELALFESPFTLQKFLNSSTLDAVVLLLAKGGFNYYLTIERSSEEDNFSMPDIKHILKSLKSPSERRERIELLKKHRVFITTNKEVMASATLLGNDCVTPFYVTNRNYNRVYAAMNTTQSKELKYLKDNSVHAEVKEVDRSRGMCASLFMAAQRSSDYVQLKLKMEFRDMLILMVLFQEKDTVVTLPVVVQKVVKYNPRTVAARLKHLVAMRYVSKQKIDSTMDVYSITALGIEVVAELLDRVVQEAINI